MAVTTARSAQLAAPIRGAGTEGRPREYSVTDFQSRLMG